MNMIFASFKKKWAHWGPIVMVFLISLIPFLFFCPEWFFDGEDWGLILKASQCSGLKDFFRYFLYGKVNNLSPIIATDNPIALAMTTAHDSFFTVYYRPMILSVYAIQYQILGLNAYAYFVCILLMHATIATLLFYLLSKLVRPAVAILCSLFFSFHPLLYGWFGQIDTQQHMINVLLMLMLFIAIKKSLETGKWTWYSLTYLIFFISLLTRETILILPAILCLWWIASPYGKYFKYRNKIALLAGICLIICFYFFIKSITYPILFSMPRQVSLISSGGVTQHITNIIRFLYDLFWLQWFPWTAYDFFKSMHLLILYKFIKLTLVSCVIALFITNTQKKFIILSALTAMLIYWPIIVAPGGLRLFYESLPFMILALAYLLHYSTLLNNRLIRYAIYGLFSLLIICNGCAIIKGVKGMQSMMVFPKKIDSALQNLKQTSSQEIVNKPLLIINMHNPNHAIGIIQAFELYGINKALPRYFFRNVKVLTTQDVKSIGKFIRVQKDGNSIRLISLDPNKVWFETVDFDEFLRPIVVHMTINQATHHNHISDLSLNFEKDFYHPDLMVLIWFFEQEQFVPLFFKT